MSINNTSKKDDILKAYKESDKKNKELENQNKELEEKLGSMASILEELKGQINTMNQPVAVEAPKVKSIKLMSLSMGQCYLSDDRFSMKFEKAFDQIPIRETVFEDFFYKFKKWFDEMEVIILDDEVAEEYGMKFYYDQYGLSETAFKEAMEKDDDQMMAFVKNLPHKMQMTFIVEFAREMNRGNEHVDSSHKQNVIEKYVRETFGFELDLQEVAQQYKDLNIM